jgi:Protein of unknown function (DUF3047)
MMTFRLIHGFWLVACLGLMAGCSGLPTAAPSVSSGEQDLGSDQRRVQEGWSSYALPGKRATEYRFTHKEGRAVIEARADRSSSMLRRTLDKSPEKVGEVSWSWWVDAVLVDADLADVDRTDSPAQLLFAFDGDKSTLSPRARVMLDLARVLTGEEPPYATLTYAFATNTPVESVVKNPRTERIRKIVVDSGTGHTKQWRSHRRNLVDDYIKAFGEPPGRLIGVAVMTDADNTRSRAKAWYGQIEFSPRADVSSPAVRP